MEDCSIYLSRSKRIIAWIAFSIFTVNIALSLLYLKGGDFRSALGYLALSSAGCAYFGWVLSRMRTVPVLRVTGKVVEWGTPYVLKKSSISRSEIRKIVQVTQKVLLLETLSSGMLLIPLYGPAVEDRKKVENAFSPL
jgi:hypothetical protein